jgi:hypothetical protein
VGWGVDVGVIGRHELESMYRERAIVLTSFSYWEAPSRDFAYCTIQEVVIASAKRLCPFKNPAENIDLD